MMEPIHLALEYKTYRAGLPILPWKDALMQTASLLEAGGFINGGYVEKIIADSEPLHFYYVVGPNIAMPHARPEFGAKKTGLALVTCPDGILFADHEFNPVHVIFMISVLETDGHIDFIMKMAEILQNRPFIEALSQCRRVEEIENILKSYK